MKAFWTLDSQKLCEGLKLTKGKNKILKENLKTTHLKKEKKKENKSAIDQDKQTLYNMTEIKEKAKQ